MAKKRGMGARGLSTLISGKKKSDANPSDMRIEKIEIEKIIPGAYQPRYKFDESALEELSNSIKVQGIVQPIIVKRHEDQYEIIAGERRWRAAKLAGLERVPVVVRQADNQASLAMGLIENMQREDLNPIETATGLKRLMEEFDLTQQQVADAIGRSRSGVTNLLRLLSLPSDIQEWLHDGMLSMGHARAIVTCPENEQLSIARQAIKNDWSVRDIERAVKQAIAPSDVKQVPASKPNKPMLPASLTTKRDALAKRLGAKLKISHKDGGKGRIEISYQSEEELDRILSQM